MTFLALVAIIFFGFATYNLTCAFVDIPTKKTSRMMMLARKQQGVKAEKLLDVYITKIAGLIAPYLKLDTTDVPGIVKLVSKDFHITDEESSGVLQRLIEGNDLTLYGLSNAVTRHSQDVPDYDRATALEGIGYNILSMPARQWSRINQLAA